MIDFVDMVRAFVMKLEVWEINIKYCRTRCLKHFLRTLTNNNNKLSVDISEGILSYLYSLRNESSSYFPDIPDFQLNLLRNPFRVEIAEADISLQEEFIELINDSTAKG